MRKPREVYPEAEPTVLGLGTEDRSRSKILMAMDTRINDRDCKQLWNADYHIFNIVTCANSSKICYLDHA